MERSTKFRWDIGKSPDFVKTAVSQFTTLAEFEAFFKSHNLEQDSDDPRQDDNKEYEAVFENFDVPPDQWVRYPYWPDLKQQPHVFTLWEDVRASSTWDVLADHKKFYVIAAVDFTNRKLFIIVLDHTQEELPRHLKSVMTVKLELFTTDEALKLRVDDILGYFCEWATEEGSEEVILAYRKAKRGEALTEHRYLSKIVKKYL